jgi:dTDP-4-amino-4,6-dideoxygalactose transaminase
MLIQLSKPSVSSQEIKSVEKVILTGYLGMGPKTKEFENDLSHFFGRNVICTSSGTSALHIALQAVKSLNKKRNEVLVPSLTYAASYQAITGAGLKPVSCDISPKTLNICFKDIKKKYNKKTLAIMPVHYSGDPTGINKINSFAKKNQIRVIEDAAHAFGSSFKNKLIGSFGDITCFSFDGIKNITCGEGGAIVSNDELILSKASDIRTLGIIGDSARRTEKKRSWSFDIEEQGYRYHMSDINAAIGVVQLKRFASFQRKRKLLAKNYDKIFQNSNFISTFNRNYDEVTPHIYAVKLLVPNSREELQNYLLSQGIQTGYHYFPNHQLTYFQKKGEVLPVVESIFPNLLTLPSHVGVSKADVKLVFRAINSFYV